MVVQEPEMVPDRRLAGKSPGKTRIRGLRAPVKYGLAAVAAVLAGGAAGVALMSLLYGPVAAQSIVFTSQPASAVVGATYQVTARGGGSGNPVTAGIDPVSTAVCSISATATVTFNQPGTCIIDASQAGNDRYAAAPLTRQAITVDGAGLTAQSVVFTSQPTSPVVGGTYQIAARGGGSGNPVTVGIDPASTAVCSISATATVTFNQPGTCIIDASQAGNSRYSAAPQVRQTITVRP